MNTESPTDRDLIDAANRGDTAAFGRLYDRYRDWVWRVASRHCADPAEAMDVVQETFIYMLGKFPGFRLAARMTTFLYPVVIHLARDARRRSRPSGPLAGAETAVSPLAAPGDESQVVLAQAVGQLPEAQREVLLMRFADDMAIADIAAAMGVPEGTVKSRLHHALARLRGNPGLRQYYRD